MPDQRNTQPTISEQAQSQSAAQATTNPNESGRIIIIEPSNSGTVQPLNESQTLQVQTIQEQASQNPRAIPILSEKQDPRYAQVNAAAEQAYKAKKRKARTLAAIIIASILFLCSILLLLAYIFKPFGLFEEQLNVSKPTQFQIQKAFEDSEIPYPSVNHFKYVNTNNLRMASIGQYEVGEVEYSRVNGKQTAYCEGSAVAHYRNGFLDVDQDLAVNLEYDVGNNVWKPSDAIEEAIQTEPTDLPDMEAIKNDFSNILQSYDTKLAQMYSDAEIAYESNLTTEGGSAIFMLTTTAEDGSAKSCTVNTEISWEQASGWNVEITTVDGDVVSEEAEQHLTQDVPIVEPEPVQPEPVQPPQSQPNQPSPPTGGDSTGGGSSGGNNDPYDGATLSLVCNTGDLVEIIGTIQFDSTGHVLLKTDERMAIILDGHTYITDYFEVNGPNFINGQHTSIIGYISATSHISQSPLLLDSYY